MSRDMHTIDIPKNGMFLPADTDKKKSQQSTGKVNGPAETARGAEPQARDDKCLSI